MRQSALALTPAPGDEDYPRKFVTIEVDVPTPDLLAADQVLVEGGICCLCSTDNEMRSDSSHGLPTIGMDGYTLNGHERGGYVTAVGSKDLEAEFLHKPVTLMVREGGRFGVGKCPECARNRPDMCTHWDSGRYSESDMGEHGIFEYPGWFTNKVIVPISNVVPLPDGLDPRLAVHGDSAAIGAKAYLEAKLTGEARYAGWGEKKSYKKKGGGLVELPPVCVILGGTGNSGVHATSTMLSLGWKVINIGTTPAVDANGNTPEKIARVQELGGKYHAFDRDDCASTDFARNPYQKMRQALQAENEIDESDQLTFDLVIDFCGNGSTLARIMEAIESHEILVLTSILSEQLVGDVNIGRLVHRLVMNNGSILGVVNASREATLLGLKGLAYADKKRRGLLIDQINPCYGSVEELASKAAEHLEDCSVLRTGVDFGQPL